MRTTSRAAVAALALLLVGSGLGVAQAEPSEVTAAGPALRVDPTAGRQTIDPNIYGMNFSDEALAKELRLPVNRWGGNATTRYNYLTDSYNAGSDWYFENLYYRDNDPSALPNGSEANQFVEQNIRTGTDSLITVPLIGWTSPGRNDNCGFSVLKYGPQQWTDAQWRPDCGNGWQPDGTTPITGNDPNDTSIPIGPDHTRGWVEYLNDTYGAAGEGGVNYYALDNEPILWQWTHRDIHPKPVGWKELRDATYATASALKEADPGAQTLGPVEWGFPALTYAEGDGCGDCGLDFGEWYLQQMAAYEKEHGTRILDYFDIHLYPQQNFGSDQQDPEKQALRLRSTRQLWDASYVDESWINQPIQFIPRLQSLVEENYPGTRTAITEYSWGAHDHIVGGLAQADVLGIYGREGLDMATLWDPPQADDPTVFAFRMYRNYDGQGGAFGDVSVQAASEDQDDLAVYAAERSSDGALTVMVVNKTTEDLTAPLSLVGGTGGAETAEVYQYGQTDTSQIHRLPNQPLTDDGFTTTFPAYSVTEFVLPARATENEPPSAPGTPRASAVGSDQVTLTWQASTPGTSPVAGYEVYSGTAGGAPVATVDAPATSVTVTNLTPDTPYTLHVVAKDTEGRSSPLSGPVEVRTAPGPAATCQVAYSVASIWGSGFTANIRLTNHGAPVDGWELGFSFTGGQRLTHGWNGTWSQNGDRVTVTDVGWNARLGTSASTVIGFNGSHGGVNPTPGSFTLNGAPCTTAGTTGPVVTDAAERPVPTDAVH